MARHLGILGFAALALASPLGQLEVRQATSFAPQPRCTNPGGAFSKGYKCLNSLGAATASAYCSSRFITTSTATTPTFTITDITVTSTVNVTGTSTSTVTTFNSTVTSTFNATATSFTCPGSTAAPTSPTGSTSTPTVAVPTKIKRQAPSSITPPPCFAASVSPRARTICLACFGVTSGSVTTVYSSTRTYASTTIVTSTSIITPSTTITAVATVNATSTTTVTTAYAIPTSNFVLLYPTVGPFGDVVSVYGRARNLSSGVAISLEQNAADNFRIDDSRHLRDVSEADKIASEPSPGLLDILFLMNTTSSTSSTPVCYVCGDVQTIGCDYPNASGNVTNPGANVWANCGGFLSLGLPADFANPPLGVTCSIIRRLFYSLTSGTTAT